MAPRAFDVDRLGPYRILRALESEGTTSFVAREEGPVGFRRDVVLKVVPERDPLHALAAQELAQEATLGSRLNHPNIVRTHDFFARGGRLVLVVEHVDGITLAQLLASLRVRQERLSDQEALYVGVAVLEALAHAHAQLDAGGADAPVVHHRLDPSHVTLGRDGSVKVSGFSALPSPRDPASVAGDPSLGSAPAGADAGRKADVRAVGLLFWEMLTGRQASAGLEPLSAVRANLPRELSAAVGAALDVATAKRAIGCTEVASWIKKVARFAGGRDEVRARVMALVPPADPETAPDADGESARVPLLGWSVRLAPIANRVLAVGTAWARVDAALRRHLQNHRRASLATAIGVVGAIALFALLHGPTHPVASAAARPSTRLVPAAAPVPTAPTELQRAVPPAPLAAKPVDPPVLKPAASPPAIETNAAPSDSVDTTPPPADKVVYAIPGGQKSAAPAPPKGFGYLTVHSSLGYAYVYVKLFKYGQVERRLIVRCGKRFVSLGAPKAQGGEPTWFAPSRTVDVPCGGSLEITMMPKWIP